MSTKAPAKEFKKETSNVVGEEAVAKALQAFGITGGKGVNKASIQQYLDRAGIILESDPRMQESAQVFEQAGETLTEKEFSRFYLSSYRILNKVFNHKCVIPDFATFRSHLEKTFEDCRNIPHDYLPAQYISELAETDPSLYAMAFVTVDGQVMKIGDVDHQFTLQSASKPISYLVALGEHGTRKTHQYIGQEPSGISFNAFQLNPDQIPHNPMVNAGAIMASSLIKATDAPNQRFKYVMSQFASAMVDSPGFDNATFLAEMQTADRNRCLAYLMQECGAFLHGKDPSQPRQYTDTVDLNKHLELYISTCSLTTDILGAACIGATLANGGVNPMTGAKVWKNEHVKNALSLMCSCGMYDYSGQWAFQVGLPAKSGVSGVIIVPIPGVGGLAIFSPPLHDTGNSFLGINVCKKVVEDFSFHVFDASSEASNKIDPTINQVDRFEAGVGAACELASTGDLLGLMSLHASGLDLSLGDYDHRTPLHLAAAEGNMAVVEYLVGKVGVDIIKDRWGGTPLDDAVKSDRKDIVAYLSKAAKNKSPAKKV